MKIISDKHHIIKENWYLQEYNSFDKYELSPYVVIFPKVKNELWYNMLTGELILIEENDLENKELFIRLVKNWYYINVNLNPRTIADIIAQIVRDLHKRNKDTQSIKYVITSTYTCNARCHYCYENALRQKPMTDEIALEIGKFLVKQAQKNNKELNISWFGGEPLCGGNAIRIISNYLRDNNIKFKSSMITNGYLINEFPIKEIRREWNLTNCQITLDGTKDNYQSIKNFKNEDPNAYERVLNNIETFLENGICISIRLNVSKENGADLLALTEYLVDRFHSYKNILNIYTSPLFEGIESNFMVMEISDSFAVHDYCKKIEDIVREHGMYIYRENKFNYASGHCMADLENPIVITVDGNITPCEHYFEKYICGNIWDGITNTEPLEMFKEKNKNLPECDTCFYYPKCYRLKHCPTEYVCAEPQREFIKYKLKNVVDNKYEKYLVKQREKGEELC